MPFPDFCSKVVFLPSDNRRYELKRNYSEFTPKCNISRDKFQELFGGWEGGSTYTKQQNRTPTLCKMSSGLMLAEMPEINRGNMTIFHS